MRSLLLTIAALGVTLEASAQSIPKVDAQLYRSSVDGDGFVMTDTVRGLSDGLLLRTSVGVGTGLLAYQPPRGQTKMLLSGVSSWMGRRICAGSCAPWRDRSGHVHLRRSLRTKHGTRQCGARRPSDGPQRPCRLRVGWTIGSPHSHTAGAGRR